eukprot:CAMPEP_0119296890 /NCGR_PEP_ID=MMETSP1329-20130426/50797_1 /TAXON_ID=114041 /ORGANISM="Genus nov. species nov., Strain RCC1024" /LENGTH=389 /DNA_ID=CAMNT_0007297831 /DNA_START=45 /DNA_END=1215 /DNA_ORIENTATION=+
MSPLRRGARARYGRLSDFPLHRVAHGGGRAEAERVRGAARVLAAERVRGAPRVLARLAPGRGGRVDVRLGVEARGRVGRVGRVGDGEHVLEVVGFRLEHLRRPLDGRRRAPRKEHPGGAMPSSGVRRVSRKRSSAHSRGLLSSAASRRPRADAAARRGARAAHLDELQREVEVGEPPRHVGERLPVRAWTRVRDVRFEHTASDRRVMSASGSRFSSVARACRELTQVQVQGSPSSRSSSSCALVHLRKRARLERPWPLDVGRTLSASPRRASRKVVALQRGLGGAPVRKFVPPRRRRRGRVLHAVGAEHSAQQELVPGDDHLPFLIDAAEAHLGSRSESDGPRSERREPPSDAAPHRVSRRRPRVSRMRSPSNSDVVEQRRITSERVWL